MANIDIEKGMISSTTQPATSQNSVSAQSPGDLSPLESFQLLVGIHTPASLSARAANVSDATTQLGHAWSAAHRTDNVGLYQRAKELERSTRLAYIMTSFISNTLYMLQILLAATLTALSAYKDSEPVTLTVLGALNTVLAGCLAWQKGQGIPQRYRKAQDQYQALLLEIEMAERCFVDAGCSLDPRVEKDRLQVLFDTARADQQANYPDLYVSTGGGTAGKSAGEEELKKQVEAATKRNDELVTKLGSLVERLEGKVESKAEGALDSAGAIAAPNKA